MSSEMPIRLGGERLLLDVSGAAWWPRERTLIFSDLHLEKGSFFAQSGQYLPPYDSRATLARMASAVARYEPARIVALGDSFHDAGAADRLGGGRPRRADSARRSAPYGSGSRAIMTPRFLHGLAASDARASRWAACCSAMSPCSLHSPARSRGTFILARARRQMGPKRCGGAVSSRMEPAW